MTAPLPMSLERGTSAAYRIGDRERGLSLLAGHVWFACSASGCSDNVGAGGSCSSASTSKTQQLDEMGNVELLLEHRQRRPMAIELRLGLARRQTGDDQQPQLADVAELVETTGVYVTGRPAVTGFGDALRRVVVAAGSTVIERLGQVWADGVALSVTLTVKSAPRRGRRPGDRP